MPSNVARTLDHPDENDEYPRCTDPEDPSRLRPAYDSGDHLHPNTAGCRAMARAVPLRGLQGTGCR